MKISIFERPIITQTLNINNLKATSAKSIKLHTIRKLVKYSFKNVTSKAMFTLTVFEILLSERRSVLPPVQRGAGSERVNVWTIFCYTLNFRSKFLQRTFSRDCFRKKQQMETLSTSQIESNLDYKIHLNS